MNMDGYSRAVRLWQSYGIASAAELDKYLHSFRILFAYHSGKIENEEITCRISPEKPGNIFQGEKQ